MTGVCVQGVGAVVAESDADDASHRDVISTLASAGEDEVRGRQGMYCIIHTPHARAAMATATATA